MGELQGIRIGYVRISGFDQNPEQQLLNIPASKMFVDTASSKDTHRPQLTALLNFAREDDTVVVHSMDRLARNPDELHRLVKQLTERGVRVEFVKECLTFTGENSPQAKAQLSVMEACAEFTKALARERQREGIALAKQRGAYQGRKNALSSSQVADLCLRAENGEQKASLARAFGISRETVYKYLRLPRSPSVEPRSPVPNEVTPQASMLVPPVPESAPTFSVWRLKVELLGVTPRVWRRFDTFSDVNLTELHYFLQGVMGWDLAHLFSYDRDGVQISTHTRRLCDVCRVGDVLTYTYDFGDNWKHLVTVEKTVTAPVGTYPRLLAGRNACPPEDCGGPWDYKEMLKVLAGRSSSRKRELVEWLGKKRFDAKAFDISKAAKRLDEYAKIVTSVDGV
jgi:DNA invertase Pin-like site-specific DNA recombinase